MKLPGAANVTEHLLACAVKATDMSAPRPAASIISTPLRSITTRRVWGASSANSPDSAAISDSAFARDHSNVFGYSGFETQPQLRFLVRTAQALLFRQCAC